MESEIIYDDLKSPERFYNGLTLDYIRKTGAGLDDDTKQQLIRATCHDNVKDCKENWFYLYPLHAPSMTLLEAWIKEIAPIFPTLDIKILKSKCSISSIIGLPSDGNDLLTLHYSDPRGNPIYLVLRLAEKSISNYAYTNSTHFKEGWFMDCTFICRMFVDYCVENKADVSKVSYLTLIKSFISENMPRIKEEFSTRPHSVEVIIPGQGGRYRVFTNQMIDSSSVTIDKITTYLTLLVTVNTDNITTYLDRLGLIEKPSPFEPQTYVQALYSRKRYRLEAYLAHHLIRAGLSYECEPFVRQYFKIKEQFPDEYFWNLIFLTQFGFNFFYYYWLTNKRTFKFTTPKAFEAEAYKFPDTSSQTFFRIFSVDHSKVFMRHLEAMYRSGDFRNMARLLGGNLRIAVKPERQEALTNLRIADSYEVSFLDDNYFHVRGDDFRMHKYAKHNFNIV